MNCCTHGDRRKDCKEGKEKKHIPHWLHMALCCGIPVVLVLLLPYIGKLIPGSAAVLSSIIPLICPLMMGFMLFGMMRNKKCGNEKSTNSRENDETKSFESKNQNEPKQI